MLPAEPVGTLTQEDRRELAGFLDHSVLPSTKRAYDAHWGLWKAFLKSHTSILDPFLRTVSEAEKPGVVSLFLHKRFKQGLRCKQATAPTAGIKLAFARALLPTEFLNHPTVAAARHACRRKPEELRAIKDAGTEGTVKLPLCGSILDDIRKHLWHDKAWDARGLRDRMAYLACVWGFDQTARVSEYTIPEGIATDHCIRVDDVSFYVQTPNGIVGLTGSSMAYSLRGAAEEGPDVKRVMECRVLAVSTKGKITVKAKLVGRRSPMESRFLDDLVIFLVRSGTFGKDELFSFRLGPNPKVALTSFVVRREVKSACDRAGLPSKHFSSHSLRKGGVTHMRALGACEDDRRDRGNWAPGSQVMNDTYDYGHGLGPLAAESLTGGYLPSVTDVQRILPVLRGQRWQSDAASLVRPGEGHLDSRPAEPSSNQDSPRE
jgi:hypothetical protein